MSLHDLRTIPEYNTNPLYNSSDNSPNWRLDKQSLIWRQVDAARILACLQGDYDQVFYSDADVTNLNIASAEVQSIITKHGLILAGGVSELGSVWYENQMFGFDRRMSSFFNILYKQTAKDVLERDKNGYKAYINLIRAELKIKMGLDTAQVVFKCEHDGTQALHPNQKSSLQTK